MVPSYCMRGMIDDCLLFLISSCLIHGWGVGALVVGVLVFFIVKSRHQLQLEFARALQQMSNKDIKMIYIQPGNRSKFYHLSTSFISAASYINILSLLFIQLSDNNLISQTPFLIDERIANCISSK